MNDLISRQAAIDAVHDEFDGCLVWDESGQTTADEVERILYGLPSATPEAHVIKLREDIDKDSFIEAWKAAPKDITFLSPENDGWIPVTERLPEDGQKIIVTCSDDGTTDFGQYDADKNWCVNDSYWPNAFDFTAWMPLPEPYTED